MPPEMISRMRRSCSNSNTPKPFTGTSMLPPEDEGESDRDQRRRHKPHRNKEDRQMAGALGCLDSQGLGVHDDPFARPVADERIEIAHQSGHPVDRLGEGFEVLLQPRLGTAILAHPRLDQRPSERPDIDLGVETSAHPLDLHHCLLEQQKLWLSLHLELLGDLEELGEKAGERNLLERLAEDRLANGAASLGEGLDRPTRRHVARGEVYFRYPPVVAG